MPFTEGWRPSEAYFLLTTTKLVDVSGNGANIRLGQTSRPCGHYAEAGEIDGLANRIFVAAIQPDSISQIRRALISITFSVFSVTR